MQSGAFHKPLVLSLLFAFSIAHCAFAANRLVINEVMINEPGSETSLEWVELFNAAEDSINLLDYIFIEAADTTRFASHWLPTRAFVVLSRKPLSTDNSASFERQWGNASNIWGDDSLENYL
ncbi:MAG: lamin tail domain-containing protein, partial [Candidatus Zixiibacteriota bacterium]